MRGAERERSETMDLVKVEENAVTVTLSWVDLSLLGYMCRQGRSADFLGAVPDWDITAGYVDALGAFFDAAGLASWAHTTTREDATVESWRTVVELAPEDQM